MCFIGLKFVNFCKILLLIVQYCFKLSKVNCGFLLVFLRGGDYLLTQIYQAIDAIFWDKFGTKLAILRHSLFNFFRVDWANDNFLEWFIILP